MQDTTSSSKYSTEPNSEILDLSESCVRSDIAEIISKMYTPRMEMPRSLNIDTTSFQGLETRKSAVSREMLFKMNEDQSKHIGFFSETITKNEFGTVISNTSDKDSSMSDSVSIPIVERVTKSSRKRCVYYCECCRRNMMYRNSLYRAKKACRNCYNCNQNSCLDIRALPQPKILPQLEPSSPSVYKGQGDFLPKQKLSQINLEPSKAVPRCSKCLSTVVPPRRSRSDQLGRGTTQRQLHEHVIISTQEELAIDPSLVLNHPREQATQKSNPNEAQRIQSKTLLRRFITNITSWHITFHRDKMSNPTQVLNSNLDVSENVTKIPLPLCYCQDKNKQLSNSHKTVKPAHFSGDIPLTTQKSPVTSIGKTMSKDYENVQRKENEFKRFELKSPATEDRKRLINNSQGIGNKDDKAARHQYDEEEHSNREKILYGKVKADDEIIDSGEQPPNLNPGQDGFYNFGFGHRNHFQRADGSHPLIFDRTVAEVHADWATMFWARVFGFCHKAINFFTAFLLELLKFLLHGVIHPLLWRTVEITSDYFFRPCLSTVFFNIMQPVFILLQNMAMSLRDLCLPIAQCFGHFLREVAYVFSACRIVEVNKTNNNNYDASRNP